MYKLAQLLYLMAPAYLANMAPPFVKYWKGPNPPISRRWLGAHKTVGGFALGIAVAVAAAGLQRALDWEGALVSYERWPLIGLALGFGALAGDALKSLVKRRLGIAPGQPWMPADQLDFVAGALVFAAPFAGLDVRDVVLIAALSFAGDLAVNQLAFRLGIRDAPL